MGIDRMRFFQMNFLQKTGPRVVELALLAAFVGLAIILHTSALQAQETHIRKRLEGGDLSGVGSLTLSPNGELVAGLAVLHGESGPGSLIKIWTIKEKKLLHQFRVPGRAHAVTFTPDSSTVVIADEAGQLACESTIRFWDLTQGKGRKRSVCVGLVKELVFSPDGRRLAAVAKLGPFENMADSMDSEMACVAQIHVWQFAGEGDALRIDIAHPCGEWVELWPSSEKVEPWAGEQIQAAIRQVVPTRLRFSPDGKQLISETDAGFSTIYDSQTGRILQHPKMSSVGVFKTMLMIALHEVPADVTAFIPKLSPSKVQCLLVGEQTAGGSWEKNKITCSRLMARISSPIWVASKLERTS